MIVIDNLMQVANQIETERGVTKEVLFSAIEQAIVSACRRKLPEEALVEAVLNSDSGEVTIYRIFNIVKEIEDDSFQMTPADAKKRGRSTKEGEDYKEVMEIPDLGRIAAQTAKQVIIQRIREAEKESVYDEFKVKENRVITGTVQRIENQNYLVNLGRTEAVLPVREQIPGERFSVKEKIKLFVVEVEKGTRGNYIKISRTHPGLLRCLFELEIPEIEDKIIEIMSVAREPGKRAKVAVKTNNPAIGAVGTCVGQMGGRIQSIIKELGNEKIDVLEWDENPKVFVANALKPAQVTQVVVTNADEREAVVVVPSDQLSLAIGKQGINVRLSVKLTGWKLDIMKEEEYNEKAMDISSENNMSILDKIQKSKDLENSGFVEGNSENSLAAALAKASSGNDDSEATDAPIGGLGELAAKMAKASKQQAIEAVELKVSDLAKQLSMKTAELIEEAKSFGVEISSNRAKLDPDQVAKIKENIS
ncbi:transcription termination/antitermination protein NusA [Candidatus Marinamargulisbacteria bacterium SCGC AAA071-K20]|nr:transcription termination/antitermination protein NusA [Candidatus Marinamargulisbacteria bacterium SCGC AAA071-K20]